MLLKITLILWYLKLIFFCCLGIFSFDLNPESTSCQQRPCQSYPEAWQDHHHGAPPHLAHSDGWGVDQSGGAAQRSHSGWLWQEEQVRNTDFWVHTKIYICFGMFQDCKFSIFSTVWMWHLWLSLKSGTSSWEWKSLLHPSRDSRSLRSRSRPRSSLSLRPLRLAQSTNMEMRLSPPPPATTRRRPSLPKLNGELGTEMFLVFSH